MRLSRVTCLFLLITGCSALGPGAPVVREDEAAVPPRSTAPQPEAVPAPALPPVARAPASAPREPVRAVTPGAVAPAASVPDRPSAARGTENSAAASRPPASSVPADKPPAARPPAAPPGLDLNALKEQLKETKAIGVFTKLSLKNQVDELLQQFRDFYQGRAKLTLAQLRRSYDLLLMKVLSLLQDTDQKLAAAIVASRESIWALLSDPKKFSTLEG